MGYGCDGLWTMGNVLWMPWTSEYGYDGLCGLFGRFGLCKSYVLAAFNGDNLPEQLRVQRRAYCADSMAFVDTLMDIGDA